MNTKSETKMVEFPDERGYEVVCPDGRCRHYPYRNKGDAVCDARMLTSGRDADIFNCILGRGARPEWLTYPPCPGGKHTIRAVTFNCSADVARIRRMYSKDN